jgi:hypothetical protein
VLYLNMELPEYFMAKRVRMILDARKTSIEPGTFHVINLRGFAAHLELLRPKLEHAIEKMDFSLIVLDPTYKLMPGGDENGTEDSSRLLNEIERLAVKSGALCAFASHFSKGNQATKRAQDRISGSGVFARDPDSIVILTEHVEDMAFTVDFILRNHPPVTPFVVKWDFPLFVLDTELDPESLKEEVKKGGRPLKPINITEARKNAVEKFIKTNPGVSQNDLVEELERLFKLSDKTVRTRVIPELEKIGLVVDKTTSSYSFSWKNPESEGCGKK